MKRFGLVFLACLLVSAEPVCKHIDYITHVFKAKMYPGICGTQGHHDVWSGSTHGQDCECHRQFPKDCTEIKSNGQSQSGVYTIQPSTFDTPFYVYCDMVTDGGGWTVFQRRVDGSVGFFRYWNVYKAGFGNVNSEFWLGNEKLFYLTAQGSYELRVDMSDFDGESRFAAYDFFRLGDEENRYKLFLGAYSGNAGDSLSDHSGKYFTTRDSDSDESDSNCAELYSGAWWYGACHSSNLNGLYLSGAHSSYANGINWYSWRQHHYSLKTTEMKIRRL